MNLLFCNGHNDMYVLEFEMSYLQRETNFFECIHLVMPLIDFLSHQFPVVFLIIFVIALSVLLINFFYLNMFLFVQRISNIFIYFFLPMNVTMECF